MKRIGGKEDLFETSSISFGVVRDESILFKFFSSLSRKYLNRDSFTSSTVRSRLAFSSPLALRGRGKLVSPFFLASEVGERRATTAPPRASSLALLLPLFRLGSFDCSDRRGSCRSLLLLSPLRSTQRLPRRLSYLFLSGDVVVASLARGNPAGGAKKQLKLSLVEKQRQQSSSFDLLRPSFYTKKNHFNHSHSYKWHRQPIKIVKTQ